MKEGEKEGAKYLNLVLPAKRQTAIDAIDAIKKAYRVGETVTNKAGKVRAIRFSADMVLRYFTKENNAVIEEKEKAEKTAKRAKEKAAREAKKAAEEKAKAERKAERERIREEKRQKAVEKSLQKSSISPEMPKAGKNESKGAKGTKASKGTKKNEVKPAA